MIRQDYLLRLIEQAAQMLAKMLGLQAAGQHAEAAHVRRDAAEKWLGLSADRLRTLRDDELIDHLQQNGALAEFPLRLGLAISLLRAEGNGRAVAGDRDGAIRTRATALCLLIRAHILNVAPDLPDFTPRTADLLTELPFEDLPVTAVVLLMCYHEHLGEFSRAEDALFALRQREGDSDWLRDLGGQFYQRLQRRTDAELLAGDLPRPEVGEGLAAWIKAGQP